VESLRVLAVDFRCFAGIEPEGREEPNPTHSIVFIKRGLFRRTHRGEALLADPNYVSSSTPLSRNATHIQWREAMTARFWLLRLRLLSNWLHNTRLDTRSAEAPFRLSYGICSKRGAWLHYELLAPARRSASQIAVDDVLSELT
jgi:hypothetical protein